MDDVNSYQVVFITSPNSEEAHKIAETLVEERLAACVNIIAGCRSIYRWKGKIVTDDEVLMIAKTHSARFERFKERVSELHSYDVPEMIALDIDAGSRPYIDFLREALNV
ncbi:MAG: divalent-cation tolerance protein CutA [Candidatus Latescibacterota bacterium]